MERDKEIIYHQEGILPDPKGPIDPFTRMSMESSTSGEKARVSVTVQHSVQYGEVKCSFTLSISCPQNKQWMDYAAEHVFSQAVQYVNDGMNWLAPGLPALNVPIPKAP